MRRRREGRRTEKKKVWDLTMPLLGQGSFSTIFSFNYEEDPQASEEDAAARPSRLTAATKFAWFDKLTAHRLPPDDSTLRHVRSVDDILYLARAGARWINLLDVSRLNAKRRSQFVCETVSDEYLGRVGDALAPVVAEVKERGLFDRVYVYGFDEDGPECEPGVRKLFGGLKERFPGLRTASTLRFGDISEMGLPLDILICHIRFHNETAAQRWMDSGSNKTYMLYHSIEPSRLGHLNSFIERPAIDHRLILWQAAPLSEVASGWLFWAVNAYAVGCPANPTPHGPVRRLNGTAQVDFNPGNCIWWPKWDFWANGDGQLVYPGQASKPLGSIRLASFLDGVEDLELLRMLPPADRLPLARRMVSAVDRWATPPPLGLSRPPPADSWAHPPASQVLLRSGAARTGAPGRGIENPAEPPHHGGVLHVDLHRASRPAAVGRPPRQDQKLAGTAPPGSSEVGQGVRHRDRPPLRRRAAFSCEFRSTGRPASRRAIAHGRKTFSREASPAPGLAPSRAIPALAPRPEHAARGGVPFSSNVSLL